MARYIDADKFKEHIASFTGLFTEEGFMIDYQAVLTAIDNAYAADVVSKSEGEWETILHNPRGEMLNVYSHICKVEGCGYFYKDIRPYGHNFCPNCGSKMKGGAE